MKERRRENIGSKGALQILLRPSAPIFAAQLQQLKKGGGGISVVKELRLYSCRSIFESVSVTEASAGHTVFVVLPLRAPPIQGRAFSAAPLCVSLRESREESQ